jgi:hypothetical protein
VTGKDWFIRQTARFGFGARHPAGLHGRVHKVSVVRGGEVSVVVRFGLDEPDARKLNQGDLLAIAVAARSPAKTPAAAPVSEGQP